MTSELEAFLEEVGPVLAAPNGFFGAKPAFEALVSSSFAASLLAGELTRLAERADDEPDDFAREDVLVVHETPELALRLRLVRAGGDGGAVLESSPAHRLVAVLGGAPVMLELYQQSAPDPVDVLDRRKRLCPLGLRPLSPGVVVGLHAAEDVARFVPRFDAALLCELCSRTLHPVSWIYERATLTPILAIPAERSLACLEIGARTLAALEDAAAVPALESLFEHPAHFIRWAAVRAVLDLDIRAGLRLLERAGGDPHPHVRDAARSAFEKLRTFVKLG